MSIRAADAALLFGEKPTVSRQFTGFASSSKLETAQNRNVWAAVWGPRKTMLFGVNHSPSCPRIIFKTFLTVCRAADAALFIVYHEKPHVLRVERKPALALIIKR